MSVLDGLTDVILGERLIKLAQWHELTQQLEQVKAKELKLRNELFGQFYPSPNEGTNTVDLPDDWKLKGVYKLNRNIDEAVLPITLSKMKEGAEDRLIKYKPELVLKNYRTLEEEQKKILESALIIKPGTPSMKLVPPKEKK